MKKHLVMLMAVAAVVPTSCSKDEEKTNDLVGTSWAASESSSNYSWSETISFTSATSFTYLYQENDRGETSEIKASGSYTYDAPKLVGKATLQGISATLEETISGNTLTVTMDGKPYEIYTKK